MEDYYPSPGDGTCACGCGVKLTGRRTRWASNECRTAAVRLAFVVHGDTGFIRRLLLRRDNGMCAVCGRKTRDWEADHIIPVAEGGGGCTLENFQTLCYDCHKRKTGEQARRKRKPPQPEA